MVLYVGPMICSGYLVSQIVRQESGKKRFLVLQIKKIKILSSLPMSAGSSKWPDGLKDFSSFTDLQVTAKQFVYNS